MSSSTIPFEKLYAEPARNGVYKSQQHQGVGTPVVKMNEIFDNRRLYGEKFIFDRFQLSADEIERFQLAAYDLVFARTSVVPEGVGKCSIICTLEGATVFESNLIRVRIDQKKANPTFVFYYFQSQLGRGRILAISNGVTVRTIRGSDLKDVLIDLPERSVQDRISDTLSAYDDLIENNRRRMALLEDAARQVYQEWFVRLRFPGYEHTRIVDGVPQGWEKKKLGDVCYDVREAVLPDALEPDTPYIGLEHIPRRSISLVDWGNAEQVTSTKLRFREGEILFGKIRPYFHKVGIAFVDGVASSDTIIIRPNEERLRGLVLMTVSSDPFVANTSQTMREGSKMPRADWKQMKEYPVAVPPDGLLTTFNDTIVSITAQLKNLTFQNQKLRAARDLLLPKLMSGEIAV